jgi:putative membrane protein
MMGNWDWDTGWGMPFFGLGSLLLIVVIVVIVAVIYTMRQRRFNSRVLRETARDILDRRYACGEINKEQYDQLKRDLSG